MRLIYQISAERQQMLATIGAALHRRAVRCDSGRAPPHGQSQLFLAQLAESEIVDYFRQAGQKNATDLRQLPGRGRLSPLQARW